MPNVEVLIEGYAKQSENGWVASSTVTLIKDSTKNIIVDPGINKELLLNNIAEKHLAPKDIDIVFLTHYHIDHVFLTAMFENALTLDGDIIYDKDKLITYNERIPGTSLMSVPTPGHAHEHCALLIPTSDGDVIVAGDVFWWMDAEDQIIDVNKNDPFTKDRKALIESRKKVLELADWVIPGHGEMFKSPKKQ